MVNAQKSNLFSILFSAVPLTPLHPPVMLKYFLTDSSSALIICSQDFQNTLAPLAKDLNRHLLVLTRDKQITAQLYHPISALPLKTEDVGFSNVWYGENDAMLIYTSGKFCFNCNLI